MLAVCQVIRFFWKLFNLVLMNYFFFYFFMMAKLWKKMRFFTLGFPAKRVNREYLCKFSHFVRSRKMRYFSHFSREFSFAVIFHEEVQEYFFQTHFRKSYNMFYYKFRGKCERSKIRNKYYKCIFSINTLAWYNDAII